MEFHKIHISSGVRHCYTDLSLWTTEDQHPTLLTCHRRACLLRLLRCCPHMLECTLSNISNIPSKPEELKNLFSDILRGIDSAWLLNILAIVFYFISACTVLLWQIYGGVVMNNIMGLSTLLAIVYIKGLEWDYSAEVLTVLLVCAVIGVLACSQTTYPLWTCLLAFFLYPFSLLMYYVFQYVLGWN